MIKVEGLTRSYGDFTAVDQVSFQIGKGEVIGLLGHNGAGKTTIMKVLTGFLEPDRGRIEIDGLDIAEHRTEVQRKIGYLPENCPVYPEMTVIDYLEYIASLHGLDSPAQQQAVAEAIRETRLEPKATQLINTLSRGYRQRVGVAQAILHRPQLLILDEPTNGLDPSQIQHMRSLIKTQAENATVLISTHVLQEVQAVCDRAIIINNGHIALDARLDELQSSRRLILTVKPAQRVEDLLNEVAGVSGVTRASSDDAHAHYFVDLDTPPEETTPRVARHLIENGVELMAITPEQRDLETVFREINEGIAQQNHTGEDTDHA